MNLYKYVDRYGDQDFAKKGFNDIENLIFSALTYLDWNHIVPTNHHSINLKKASELYFSKYSYQDISKKGLIQKQAYKLLQKLVQKKRYTSIILSHYIYFGDSKMQFSALRLDLEGYITYIAYEGTDQLLSGWKEDFELSYRFPTPSQKCAISYLNHAVSFRDRMVIVGGHSKGGNLALIASMYVYPWIRRKIKKIYNNDGPGMLEKEFLSKNYQKIKSRLVHIIPNYSIVGILLMHDYDYMVVKSSRRDILAHSLFTWQVDDDHLVVTKLSYISSKLEKSIAIWLTNHDIQERKEMISSIFQALEDSGVYVLTDFLQVKKAIQVVKNIQEIDLETRNLIFHFLEFNLHYLLKK